MPVPDPEPNAMIRSPSQNGPSVGSGTSNKRTSVASQQVDLIVRLPSFQSERQIRIE
jgi:hypothetical protein